MKDSHFHTPRTLSDCDFQDWGQAVFLPPASQNHKGMWIATVIVVLLIGVIVWK